VTARGASAAILRGRLVLEDHVEAGVVRIEDGWIVAVEPDPGGAGGPYIAPGFVDVHVHGWGGHDAMGGPDALTGMARALLRRGVTSFLPTAVTAPLDELARFAERVRRWIPGAPDDGADPLGFNLEGPFLAETRRGAHAAAALRVPADVPLGDLEPLLDGLRVMTVAPELDGALELIAWLDRHGIVASLGHSAADLVASRSGFDAGARSTTHLFNAMSGLHHREPGLALAALTEDAAYAELIADGHHVHAALWPLIARTKPRDRLLLVSDAISLAGTSLTSARLGGLDVEIRDRRCVVAGSATLAGSLIALDSAVANLVRAGIELPVTAAAASRNPLEMLGVTDRGRIAVGQRADLVELDDEQRVVGVVRRGRRL